MTISEPFDHMLGSCSAMQALFAAIRKLAPSDLTVLILGETGTGKELVARSLHARSRRARGPFVALNCGALPSTLIESELFGFDKGSFTGAVASHAGHLERADGGTLFLDEIAELPWGAQAKLLRVLQDHRVQRLGSTRDRRIDLRVVAATHQDLAALVEARAFRRDLYHRLNEVQLELPPLRDRGDDVLEIAAARLHDLSRDAGRELSLDTTAVQSLRAHSWPGNVRELENVLRRAVTRCRDGVLRAGDLGLEPTRTRTLDEILEAAREAAIRQGWRRHAGNTTALAEELGISLAVLEEMLQRYGLTKNRGASS